VRLECAASTNQGRRAENQDVASYQPLDEAVLAIVADGMGGGADGLRFSQTAVARVQATVLSERGGVGGDALVSAVRAAAAALVALRAGSPHYKDSGSTLVVAGIAPGDGFATVTLAHVGDSRAYKVAASGDTQLLTVDHTFAEELMRRGLPADEASQHPQAVHLTHALGDSLDLATLPDFTRELRLTPNEALVLCTDGVSKLLDEAAIGAIVASKPAQLAADTLVAAALRAGASDNATALVVRCVVAPRRRSPLLATLAAVALVAALAGALRVGWGGAAAPPAPADRGPTLTALPTAQTSAPLAASSTPAAQGSSTPAPSVLPSATSTATQTSTATRTPIPVPTRRPVSPTPIVPTNSPAVAPPSPEPAPPSAEPAASPTPELAAPAPTLEAPAASPTTELAALTPSTDPGAPPPPVESGTPEGG